MLPPNNFGIRLLEKPIIFCICDLPNDCGYLGRRGETTHRDNIWNIFLRARKYINLLQKYLIQSIFRWYLKNMFFFYFRDNYLVNGDTNLWHSWNDKNLSDYYFIPLTKFYPSRILELIEEKFFLQLNMHIFYWKICKRKFNSFFS